MSHEITHNDITARLVNRGGIYQAQFSAAGRRVRKTTGTGNLRAAEKAARDLIDRMVTPGPSTGTMRLSEALRVLWAERWRDQASGPTRRQYVEEAIEYLGDPDLAYIPRERIVAWRAESREAGLAPATCNRKVAALLAVLGTAKGEWEMRVHVPKIKRLPEPQGRPRYLSDEEIKRLLAVARPPFDWVFRFAISTGLRRGEILALGWDQIDLQDRRVWVEGETAKSGKARGVPLSPSLVRYFTEVRQDREHLDGPWDLSVMKIRYEWQRCRQVLGLDDDPHFVFHALRHTCATRLVNRGVPTKAAKDWLGHSSIVTTQRYLNQSQRDLDIWAEHAELDLD